ncbi:DUF2238 domain-containing protein [Candidatus Woesearchaeota archaeon]|nr:DUF2238 domain-containing protein [Candidatus Woesearchaeota archaeon]
MPKYTKEERAMLLLSIITLFYLLAFAIYTFVKRNLEFSYYLMVFLALALSIIKYHKKLGLTLGITYGLSLWGFLGLMGGNLHINEIRLYDIYIFSDILRYDQFVHALGAFFATFIIYEILRYKVKNINTSLFVIIIVLATLGVGTLNEIMELLAVIFLKAQATVGDYMNNALDLLFNFIGALIAAYIIFPRFKFHIKPAEKEGAARI